jgi:hypothetical protein
MDQIKYIIDLLRNPNLDTNKIMEIWRDPLVSQLLKSDEIKSNKFIITRLPMVENYMTNIYVGDKGDKQYLQPSVIQVLKQIIKSHKPIKILRRFSI